MKISIIGAGNMAYQLGRALVKGGHQIHEVYNRSHRRRAVLAKALSANQVKAIGELDLSIDLVIIAVSDGAISIVSDLMDVEMWGSVMIVHTSGGVPSEVLSAHKNYGVFYPFQSLSMGQDMDFSQVPVLVHSKDDRKAEMLIGLAESISEVVHSIDDEQRGVLHVAGVFANNFSNHVIGIAQQVMQNNALPSSLLNPLINNTLNKVIEMGSAKAQTGPAIRRDIVTMEKHEDFLANRPEWKALYQLLSQDIITADESRKKQDDQ